MTDYEVFLGYFHHKFKNEDVPSEEEYEALMNTIDFQRYLLGYRMNGLFQSVGEVFVDLFLGMLKGINWLFNRWTK